MRADGPRVGAAVYVTVRPDAGFPTRVRDVLDSGDIVVPPAATPVLHFRPLEAGQRVVLVWAGPDAQYRMSATVAEVLELGNLVLRPVTEPERVQRRRHVRVPQVLPVVLVTAGGEKVRAVALDISESGLRCRVDREAALTNGDRGMVSFELDHEDYTLAVEVRWLSPADPQDLDLGLLFLEPGRQADGIRRSVFAFQRRQRALERG